MNWKFWQKAPSPARPVQAQMFDPAWGSKREQFLMRLANTEATDPMLAGFLGLLEQEILVQVRRCEKEGLTDAEAQSICGRIGVLTGLRADLELKWKEQRTKKAQSDAAAAAARKS